MAIEILNVAHCNVNCSNLSRSLAFYRDLVGLRPGIHTNPPPQDGAGFGLEGQIQWDAYMMSGTVGPVVDLLEWKLPKPTGTPYEQANHLGLFRLCFMVPDVGALYERLLAQNVSCLSPPFRYSVDAAGGFEVNMFMCRDPDGTVLEFVEVEVSGTRLIHANINCSELERSLEWYERVLGLEVIGRSNPGPSPGEGFGFEGNVEWNAAFLAREADPSGFFVDLLEWKNPKPIGRSYGSANHLGIYRMAFTVRDAQASYEELRSQGVTCRPPALLDILPEVRVRAVFFPDPDGTTLELIESGV